MKIVALITTYERPMTLARTAAQISALRIPVLVMDDGSGPETAAANREICEMNGLEYMRLPANRGLAASLNAGLAYWIADSSIEWITYFQDDVDIHPRILSMMDRATRERRERVFTGHDSQYHATVKNVNGYKMKKSCAGVHIHARAEFWKSVMPIPTYRIGAPMKIDGRVRGIGSNADWWIVRDAPNSPQRRGEFIVCVPGLVRTFLYKAEDSSWGNSLPYGEDQPLRPA